MIYNKNYKDMTTEEFSKTIFSLAQNPSFVKRTAKSLEGNTIGITPRMWNECKAPILVTLATKVVQANLHLEYA